MSFFKKKFFLVFVILLVLTVLLAFISKSGNNPVSNAINSVLVPVQSKLSAIVKSFDVFFDSVANTKEYIAENEKLKKDNMELTSKIKTVEEYISENERLKKLLNVSNEQIEYVTVAANVVSYEPDNWFSYITIDRGTNVGIKISDPVITSNGLLGQVSEVGENWAKISTIINSECSVGGRIVRNGEIGIVEGDVKLAKTQKCKLGYLVSNASVIAGDILETSGLGGIYPPGIFIGTITEISKDNMGRLDYAVIEPVVDFDSLYEVLVISDWSFKSYEFDSPENLGNTTDEVINDTQSSVDNVNNQNITEEENNNNVPQTFSVG